MIDRPRGDESELDLQAQALMEQVRSSAAAARGQLAEGTRRVREYVREKPLQALGIALGVGVFLGWLIKRR